MAIEINIRPDERVCIIGKTGSGKTYLAERLLRPFPYVIVLDNKGFFGTDKQSKQFALSAQGYGLCRELDQLPELARQYNKIVYRPDARRIPPGSRAFDEEMNAFFFWVFDRENCILYVDEASSVCDSYNILPGHNLIMKQGREKNIGCWNSTQQPVNVHNTLISEAEHYFIFQTRLKAHRDKVAGFVGDEIMKYERIPKRYFFYFNADDMDNPVLMKPIT